MFCPGLDSQSLAELEIMFRSRDADPHLLHRKLPFLLFSWDIQTVLLAALRAAFNYYWLQGSTVSVELVFVYSWSEFCV